MRALRTIWAVVLWGLMSCAMAHDINLTGVRVLVQAQRTILTVLTHRSRLLAAHPGAVDDAIRQELRLVIDGHPFVAGKATVTDDIPNDLVTWQVVLPSSGTRFELQRRFYASDPSAKTVLTVQRPGRTNDETLYAGETGPGLGFLREGVLHIWSGADHVLFVLGLILLGGRLRAMMKTVTAFTLAHCLTLTLAVTRLLVLPTRFVECLIALSIVAVAVENLRRQPASREDHRPKVAFLFGLFHGFGFAGALENIGLTGRDLGGALGLFNVGVEVGQAAIILAAIPLVRWLSHSHPQPWGRIVAACSVGIGVLGSFWFFERLLA